MASMVDEEGRGPRFDSVNIIFVSSKIQCGTKQCGAVLYSTVKIQYSTT